MEKKCFPKQCQNCKYFACLDGREYICDYINKTGQRRGCGISECDKYEKKKKKTNNHLFVENIGGQNEKSV